MRPDGASPTVNDAAEAGRKQSQGNIVSGEHDVDDDHRQQCARLIHARSAPSRHKHEVRIVEAGEMSRSRCFRIRRCAFRRFTPRHFW